MALAPLHQEQMYDSPSAFFETMDYADSTTMDATDLLQFSHTSHFEPFKVNTKTTGPTDPLLSGRFNSFNLDTNYWNEPSQFGALDTINPTLSPLDGNQSCDTGYASQEGSPGKSPIRMQTRPYADAMTVNPSNTTTATTATKSRKRSSTKTTSSKQSDSKTTSRKSRRTSKAVSIETMIDEEDDSKREQFLARNREAASKCRQKKKEWTQGLEQRARDLSAQKQMLTTYLAMLKNELLMLKCKCLEHSDCDCEAIRDYLKNTVTTMPPANAALYSKLEGKNASEISNEIARKQSAFGLDAFSPGDMVSSPGTDAGSDDDDFSRLEAELHAVAND
jgi:hypothetical protein